METKMRIRLFDKDERLIQDRLVEQATEFRVGPKEKHLGPIGLELNLRSKADVESSIHYLKKLALDLPLEVKEAKKKSEKTLDKMLSEKEPLLDLKKTVLEKATNQEELVTLLRDYGFMFTDKTYLQDLNVKTPGLVKLKKNHVEEDWQFMVRLVKAAKDPANDKWDCRLMFGIKILGERVEKVQIYLWGEYESTKKLPWKDKKLINFKRKEKLTLFPEFMNYEDRKKWRAEHKKLQLPENEGADKSKFYLRWAPYVKVS